MILVPPESQRLIVRALERSGARETGGVLMGEHVNADTFRVQSITVQRAGGTVASFVRLVEDLIRPLFAFFDRTGHQYRRFNYLGEWHSHPSYALRPSANDVKAMCDIVEDPEVGAMFAVLLIVKLVADGRLGGALFVFPRGKHPFAGELVLEGSEND